MSEKTSISPDVAALAAALETLQKQFGERERAQTANIEALTAQLAALQAAPVAPVQTTGKWGEIIDAVADPKAVLAECARFDKAKTEADQAVAFAAFAQKFPALAAAASANATYRKKTVSHSIGVIVRRLNANQVEA